MPYVNKPRPYKKEYEQYDGTEKVKKKRAERNKARRIMMEAGQVQKGDGKDRVRQTIENDFAQLVFHNNNISDILPFITAKPKSINKKDNGCWDFLDSIKHPCNSLVILDDYILTDSNELIEENLVELLKKIMPLKLNQNLEFQITIIGENQGIKLIDKKNKILKKLNNFYSYPINLSIIPEKIHDRRIFTNYYWIISGYGFTLFQDKKVKKETSFTFIPIFC
jgi:hypothetical protein